MSPDVSREMVEGARIVLLKLGSAVRGERVCIVSDETTRDVGQLLQTVALEEGLESRHFSIPALKVHGQEPAGEVATAMIASNLTLGVTQRSMAHTRARQDLCNAGGRYLSLPEYSLEMLCHPTLRIDYRQSAERARFFSERLTRAATIRVQTPAGTDMELKARDRVGNFCPGYVEKDYRLGSPPDIEANVSPEEDESNGVVVVDGSIPYTGFGRLSAPIRLTVKRGRIANMEGPVEYVRALETLFESYDAKARVLGEFGIGFNPAAKLCGNMLIDEGCYGTFHFGFGSNSTVGGKNQVSFHLDFIFFASEVTIDGQLYRV